MRLITKRNFASIVAAVGFMIYLCGLLRSFYFDPALESLWPHLPILVLVSFFLVCASLILSLKLERARQQNKESEDVLEKTYLSNMKAAHELRSPITSIKTVTDKIKYDDPKLHYLLEKSLKRLTTISEDLLNVQNQIKTNREADFFDLENNISQIVNEKRHEYKHIKNLFIYYRMTAPMLHEIKISKTDFYRIFSNIINNSIDAMANNKEKRIKIEIDPRDDYTNILITDNGKGIPEDQQESVFLENISYKKNSNGLGLSESLKMAKKWGGQLTIKKSGPEGTTLLLTLPYSSSE